MSDSRNPLRLLLQRRFGPFVATSFLGAFNDNLFKQIVVVLIMFRSGLAEASANTWVFIGQGLFMLPFFICAATAGQIADRHPRYVVTRWVKVAEVFIALGAIAALYCGSIPVMLLVVGLFGLQSAFFGPVKYSLLPQYLEKEEFIQGDGLLQAGTFLAILLGTIFGPVVLPGDGTLWIAGAAVLAIAIAGVVAAWALPPRPSVDESCRVDWNFAATTWRLLRSVFTGDRMLAFAMVANSWFWFVGIACIVLIPRISKDVLLAGENGYIFLLLCVSVGLAVGSLVCDLISKHRVRPGQVLAGAVGLSLCVLDLGLIPVRVGEAVAGWHEVLSLGQVWHAGAACFFVGVSGGVFTVPLLTFIQQRSDPARLSQMVAADSIISSAAMVLSSAIGGLLMANGVGLGSFLVGMGLAGMGVVALLWEVFKRLQRAER